MQYIDRWTVHMELAAGTATQLPTVILVPAWTKLNCLLEHIFTSTLVTVFKLYEWANTNFIDSSSSFIIIIIMLKPIKNR